MRESQFQAKLIVELKERLPGCIVIKNDAGYIQGIPDLLILFGLNWAALEVKESERAPFQPNQEYYLDMMDEMSFATAIYPENKEGVLDAIEQALRARR